MSESLALLGGKKAIADGLCVATAVWRAERTEFCEIGAGIR